MNYKTTVTGLISAAASFVMFAQQLHMIDFPQWAMAIAMFANVGGLAAFGIVSKDYNATGGSVPTTREAEVRLDTAESKGIVGKPTEGN